ncbi:MAG: hypothetical protein V4717_24525 [Bacteroidota bacterium]
MTPDCNDKYKSISGTLETRVKAKCAYRIFEQQGTGKTKDGTRMTRDCKNKHELIIGRTRMTRDCTDKQELLSGTRDNS